MPNLSNNGLQNLFIDGKPVRRASLGGKVFYHKHSYSLGLQENDDVFVDVPTEFSAVLKDYTDPVEGETVLFHDSNDIYFENNNDITLICKGNGEITFRNVKTIRIYDGNNLKWDSYPNYQLIFKITVSNNVLKWYIETSTETFYTSINLTEDYIKLRFNPDIIIINNTWSHFYYKEVTDNNGIASITYTPKQLGQLTLTAQNINHNVTDTETYNVKQPLYLSSDKNEIYEGETVSLTSELHTSDNIGKTILLLKEADSTNWSALLTANPIDIYDGTTTVLTCSVTDGNNNPVQDILLKLYKGDNLAKELIATLTTDNQGEASHTYTGVGDGETIFTCESGDLVSNEVTVYDHPEWELTLESDKDILSYADGDSATLTAMVKHQGVVAEGETVEFYADDVLFDTQVTDENGVCTSSYDSKGAGDLNIKCEVASRNLLQETYAIQDVLKYDDASVDNTSKYDTTYSTGQTFSYDTTENAYKLQRTSQGFGTVLMDNLTVPNNVEISYMLKITSSTSLNSQPSIILYNENGSGVGIRTGYNESSKYFILSDMSYNNTGDTIARDDYNSFSQNTWYRVELSHKNGTVTAKLYDTNDNLLKSVTGSTSKFTNNSNKVGIMCFHLSGVTILFKDLKIKPL